MSKPLRLVIEELRARVAELEAELIREVESGNADVNRWRFYGEKCDARIVELTELHDKALADIFGYQQRIAELEALFQRTQGCHWGWVAEGEKARARVAELETRLKACPGCGAARGGDTWEQGHTPECWVFHGQRIREERDSYRQAWQRDLAKGKELTAEAQRERDDWKAKHDTLAMVSRACIASAERERDEMRAEAARLVRERDEALVAVASDPLRSALRDIARIDNGPAGERAREALVREREVKRDGEG